MQLALVLLAGEVVANINRSRVVVALINFVAHSCGLAVVVVTTLVQTPASQINDLRKVSLSVTFNLFVLTVV